MNKKLDYFKPDELNATPVAPDETFASIQGYDGYYVSNYGRVLSTIYGRNQTDKDNCKTIERKVQYTGSGNTDIIVYGERGSKKGKHLQVHRLVAYAFCDIPAPYTDWDMEDIGANLEAHHIDQDKHNNFCQNIQWLTVEEHHRVHGGSRYGGRQGVCKKRPVYMSTTTDFAEKKRFESIAEAARTLGKSTTTIYRFICNGRQLDKKYYFKYAEEN